MMAGSTATQPCILTCIKFHEEKEHAIPEKFDPPPKTANNNIGGNLLSFHLKQCFFIILSGEDITWFSTLPQGIFGICILYGSSIASGLQYPDFRGSPDPIQGLFCHKLS